MSLERYKLKENPFRVTPPTKPEEIFWAGFSKLKEKFEQRIKLSLQLNNTSLVLNWGEYGSGKTHAARYFSKPEVLLQLAKPIKTEIPYSIIITLPKGKEPVYSIFSNIIDKLQIKDIREKYSIHIQEVNHAIDNITDNTQIQSVLKAVFNSNVDEISLRRYLYGNMTAANLKALNEYGILRNFNNDNDYTKFLSGLFTCLTIEKKVYSAIILWLDEFEDLAILSNVNIDKTNNFLREILDNTPNNLLIFLNLTQTALFGQEDLGQYLSEAVRSRIKDRISFDLPNRTDLIDYIEGLLQVSRISEEAVDPLYPFTEELVSLVFSDLHNPSIRSINEAFSLLLELALLSNVENIDVDFYTRHKSEIIGWKDQ